MKTTFQYNMGGHKGAERIDTDVQELKNQVFERTVKGCGVFSPMDSFEIEIFLKDLFVGVCWVFL